MPHNVDWESTDDELNGTEGAKKRQRQHKTTVSI